ncbi:hypothetical protein [Streptacidiphilus sp. PAMC 29251]
MSRTKTPRRPAARTARHSPAEIKTLVPGHARGAAAFIAMRRKGSLWAVVDSNRGDWTPDYWDGRAWLPLTEETPAKDAYRWTEATARELMEHYAQQAAEIESHYIGLGPLETVRRIEAIAGTGPGEEPVTLAQAQAAVRVAEAEVRERVSHRRVPEATAEGISVPAPKDVPGFGETSSTVAATVRDKALPDLAEDDEDPDVMTGLGHSIPATTDAEEADAERTTAVSAAAIRELTGNGDTQAMSQLPADAEPPAENQPPMPAVPPALGPVPLVDWGRGKPVLTTA